MIGLGDTLSLHAKPGWVWKGAPQAISGGQKRDRGERVRGEGDPAQSHANALFCNRVPGVRLRFDRHSPSSVDARCEMMGRFFELSLFSLSLSKP